MGTKHFKGFSVVEGDVKVKVNLDRFERQYQDAQFTLDTMVMRSMEPFMPKQTGNFINLTRSMSDALAGTGMVVAGAPPMGRSLYEGVKMVDPVYHNAGFLGRNDVWYSRKGVKKVEATTVPGVKNPYWEFSTNANPKATDHWFDAAKKADGEDWIKSVKKIAGGG